MKLRKILTVGGKAVPLVEDDIRLDLATPGRAMFRVQATAALSGIVQFSLGYSSQDKVQLFFTGYVDTSHTVDAATQRLFCREVAAALAYPQPMSLRHPTMRDVLKAYGQATGLTFIVPDKPYATRRVPCFQTMGNGFHGLDTLGAVFGIGNYIWQQQADGNIFAGSWQDSRWASQPVEIKETMFTGVTAAGAKVLPAVPALRPGVQLNGQYLTSLQLTGHEMVVKCEKSLNA